MAVRAEGEVVAGPSGGGKTTLLREKHARHDGPSIFLTTKPNERKAQSNPPMRVRKSSCVYPEDIRKAREWAIGRDETVQVIVDEVDNAPTFLNGDNGPVRKMLHEDREQGVKPVLATQNPQDLRTSQWNYGPLQQARYFIWVGPGRTWHKGFREWLNLDAEQLPSENFEYVVIEPSDPPEIIFEGRTKERFS